MTTVTVKSHSVRSAVVAARKTLGLARAASLESCRSGGEDGLYRVTLTDGTVVEATIVQRAVTEVLGVEEGEE